MEFAIWTVETVRMKEPKRMKQNEKKNKEQGKNVLCSIKNGRQ